MRLTKLKIERELEFQRRSFQLLGAIDALLTAAVATQRHTPLLSSTTPTVDCSGNHGDTLPTKLRTN